jgi:hypothetical protein
VCVAGASWAQKEILERHPDAKLRVYAVWQPILFSDFRVAWREGLLHDPRVVHLWDADKAVARWFAEYSDLRAEDGSRPPAWDLLYLFGPDARWDKALDKPEAGDGPIVKAGPRLLPVIEARLGALAAAGQGERSHAEPGWWP